MSGSETLADWLRRAIERDAEIAQQIVERDSWRGIHVDGATVVATHINRHDPARVLRDVAAKRRLLDLHEAPCDECTSDEYVTIDGVDVPRHHGTEPCTTVLLLAQSYRDEPGWREEWAIEN